MGFFQRNLPLVVAVLAGLLVLLGVFAYMPEVFHLRSHIRSVIVDLLRRKSELEQNAGPRPDVPPES